MASHSKTDLLILGAGWTSTFLIPLCQEQEVSYTATSRTGRDGTVPFVFDPESEDPSAYEPLPLAKSVLITFPIKTRGASERLVRLYKATHGGDRADDVRFIQLGTTSIWGGSSEGKSVWFDRHSAFDPDSERAGSEKELLELSPKVPATVLNLAGLWGGTRSMRNYVSKVAPSKEALKAKSSLHMIHGSDLARAILAVHSNFSLASGQRWVLTDGRVYDWWDLASAWGTKGEGHVGDVPEGPHPAWVKELMDEEGVRALPRDMDKLGRLLDGRDFWRTFGLSPARARLE